MKILFTSQELYPESPGGAGNSAYFTAKGLSEREDIDSIHVVTATDKQSRTETDGDMIVKRFQGLKIDYTTVKSTGPADIVRKYNNYKKSGEWKNKIRREIEEFDPDIIHAQHLQTAKPAIEVGEEKDIPVVLSLRDHWAVCFHSNMLDREGNRVPTWGLRETFSREKWKTPYAIYKLKQRRALLEKASGVHYISNHIKEKTEEHAKTPDSTRVVYNPINEEKDWDDENRESNLAAFVGRHAKTKGVKELISVFGEIDSRGLDYRLVIAGEGPQTQNYKDIVERKGIEEKVEFTGWIDSENIGKIYSKARLTVAPSVWYEPMGRVGLEAMSYGSVPLVSKYGGLPETVPSEDMVIDPENSVQVADKIEEFMELEECVEEMRSNFEDFLDKFGPESVAEEFIKLYQEVKS